MSRAAEQVNFFGLALVYRCVFDVNETSLGQQWSTPKPDLAVGQLLYVPWKIVVYTLKLLHPHLLQSSHDSRCALELPRVENLEERELKRKEWWDGIHELNR